MKIDSRLLSALATLLAIMPLVDVQIAVPMPMYPMPPPAPMVPMPAPPVFALPAAQPMGIAMTMIKFPEPSTTTTTTTQRPDIAFEIPVPVPVPLPMQFAIPAFQNRNPGNAPSLCPPAPERDPPAFGMAVPAPIMPPPPPIVVVPYSPPVKMKKKKIRIVECQSESSERCTDRRRFDRRSFRDRSDGINRRFNRISDIDMSGNELVRPLLTYVSSDGEVLFKTRINDDDVEQLLGDNRNDRETVRVVADPSKRQSRVVVMSDFDNPSSNVNGRRILLGGGPANFLREGRKELVFRPSNNKKISNLSVSFQVT